MSASLISIVLPVYNAAPFLPDCLDSILRQTEPDWELLAVNDFSTDDSFSILQQVAQQDDRIQVFQNTEKGIIPALRLAFAKSRGQLLTRMDADDRMLPQKLELLKKKLMERGTGYVATGLVRYISTTVVGGGYQQYEAWLNALTQQERNLEAIYKECPIPSPCWMTFRTDLERCGAFSSDIYPEDYDLAFRFYAAGLKVAGVSEILHEWRDHPQRTSRTNATYANPAYFSLKIQYFFQLDYEPQRPLVLWGAGRKGKAVASYLQRAAIPFRWVCATPTKIGKQIYGVEMQPVQHILELEQPQLLIAVSAPDGQREILAFLKEQGFENRRDYVFLC